MPDGHGANQSVLDAINNLSEKVQDGNKSHWHFSISAPRWALRTPERETRATLIAALGAFLLAVLAVILA